ncbi:MAG: leucine-rich repeat protein, partial [Clostridia bacterium]|nr:leucine-rich repeat protein [Clostridia bacterium]
MKKLLSLLLAVVMLLGCLPAMAEDDPEWDIDEYTGLVSREPAAEKLESITVPAEVNGIAVRGIEYMAFSMHKNFTQLTIADNAVMLDRRVLRDLLKLEAIDLPENLLVIREGNFTNLPKLTSVVIPASVALVHSSFNKCESLTSITFEGRCPIFVTEGTFGMFTDLPADCVIYVPDNQLSAYQAAFADREDVLARIQPSGGYAERIDRSSSESDFVFDSSTGTITGYTGTAAYLQIPAAIGGVQVKHLADTFEPNACCIVIPEGVETVGQYSLGYESLSYVSLPSTLTNVGTGAFASSRISVISYNTADVPAYEAAAFNSIKSDVWQLLLPYGSSQEQVDAFVAYVAADAPNAAVKASIIEPYSFPKLDAEAGAPFVGVWHGVAVTDGTDFYGMDMLGIALTADLQDDGTGSVDIDGDIAPGGWYVEDGSVIFAPILEEGGQPDPEEAMPFTMDENSRLCLDLGGLFVLMEKEGATYDVPAIPERPWPELDAEKAAFYIGTWDAISYIVDGETISAELVGPMTLILNDDGTAQMIEGEEEAYELRWYAESYSAYVGPVMSAAVEIFFDMNGNLQMMQDGSKVVFAPHVDVKVIEGADELLGEWLDDMGNKLTLTNDGTMTYTYAFDGWVDTYTWDMVDGAAAVTSGNWEGASIYMRDGIVFIDNDEGIFQLFSVDGDLSAYYGEDEEEPIPEGVPVGPEGEAYFGVWHLESMMGMNAADLGMTMDLYLNEDGTCSLFDGYEHDYTVWAVENGVPMVEGSALTLDDEGKLIMSQEGMEMIFVKDGAQDSEEETEPVAQPVGPEGEAYFGVWHLESMMGMNAADLGMTMDLYLNEDGTCSLF